MKKILEHFKTNDPKIYEILKTNDFTDRFTPNKIKSPDYFKLLCEDIVSQQLSIKAAKTIFSRFEALFGKEPISPKNVLNTPDQTLRDCGISWAKIKYIKDLAQKTQSGELKLSGIEKLSNEQIIEELVKIKGIGFWTAEMFLIFTLGRENVFSHGDLGLRKAAEKLYKIKNPTKEKIEKIVEKWAPYKTYGSLALWHTLD